MEKFLVSGRLAKMKLQLSLPTAKQYAVIAVKNGEDELKVQYLLEDACNRKKSETFHIWTIPSELPRTLQFILSIYPYPLSQGPVVLPNDCFTTENYEKQPISKSITEVLNAKTVFSHDVSQACYEWHPSSSGQSSWGKDGEDYEVRTLLNSGSYLCGPASAMNNMGIIYTCMSSMCLVYCPCSICTDKRKTCKRLCKAEVCKDCNSQCPKHKIEHPRIFSYETDHFMMITDMMHKYKHAYPYAGIPQSCASCTRDVQEHQLLHLVWHEHCRFCKYQMRPFEQKSVVTIEDYKYAERILKHVDDRTCSFCLVKCKDRYARNKHEDIVHRKKPGKYKCDECDKSFQNENALRYHVDHHSNFKVTCDLCGFQSSSLNNLVQHKLIHNCDAVEGYKCDDCCITFSNKRNLKRHNKEKHFDTGGANLGFVEDLEELNLITCLQCEKKFKRKSELKRHEDSVHRTEENFQCPNCSKTFARKDNLIRHTKKKHITMKDHV